MQINPIAPKTILPMISYNRFVTSEIEESKARA